MKNDSAKFSIEEAKYYWQNQFTPSQKVGAVIILALMLAGVYRSYSSDNKVQVKPVLDTKPAPKQRASKPTKTYVYVHVAGGVKLPGVYRLESNKRVIDAIKTAGGMQADAYPDALNLASKLKDGDKIYLPGKDDTKDHQPADNSPNMETGAPQEQEKVDLNQATAEHLDTLPGIGPTLAKRIVEYRQTKGSFKKVTDLQNVEGIGDKKFSLIKDKVTAE